MPGVALVTLLRPEAHNALSFDLLAQLVDALQGLDEEDAVRAIVITGAGDRAFAAGADIKEMADATPESLAASGGFERWSELRAIRTPLIAAVRGFALGGGCELAMACDMIIASEDAQFGQPEIRIGVMPGAGGTQRLTRAVGKARAMELILTGRSFDAREAERIGLVTRVVPTETTLESALALAAQIARMPPLAVMAAKRVDQRGLRRDAHRRPRGRAPGVLRPVRDGRPEGGHGGVRREAIAPLDRPLMAAAASLRYEVDDAVATLTLDRPEARNALDAELKRELLAAFTAAGADPAVRVIVLTGAGAAFCAGQDLRETTGPDAPPLSTVLRASYNPLILAMRRLEKPIIGSINGVAAGAGMALALACDLRIAADTATFVLAFGRVGLVPDSGTTWFLPAARRHARSPPISRWSAIRCRPSRRSAAGSSAGWFRPPTSRPRRAPSRTASPPARRARSRSRRTPSTARSRRASRSSSSARPRSRASPGARPITVRASPRSSRSGRRGSPGSSGARVLAFDDRWTWDFWLADDRGRHHVFYLQAPKALGDPDLRHDHATIGHAISDDLVSWTPVADALGPGEPGAWDDVATWTGSVVRDDGGWTMLYTGRSSRDGGRVQRIGRAASTDLVAWTKEAANPVLVAHDPYERLVDAAGRRSPWHEEAWRDPWVWRDAAGEGFHALVTARLAVGDPGSRGVVAHARSHDLVHWTLGAPITTIGEFGHLEVPQVEHVGDRWILVFSCGLGDVGAARRARLPGERGGSYWVEGPSDLGPFDLRGAVPFPRDDLYSVRIVRRSDGSWVALGFVDQVDGRFVGALSDPFPVPFG